jgi:peptidoglycan/LPS O-acetylase OafA/YrhL
MGSNGSWVLGHRPALDGLRGVAIVMVLLGHARVPHVGTLAGAGVILFFALSGYLITALLLEEIATAGRVSFRAFYVRRARRLLPALLALVVVVFIARVILGPWVVEWWVVVPVLLYFANWVPLFGVDLGALGATWTLSVEEQFYLLWPLLVAAMVRRKVIMVVAALLALGSLMMRWWLATSGAGVQRLMLGSDTVAFAILVGVVAVTVRAGGGPGRSRPWVVAAALVVLLSATFLDMPTLMTVAFPVLAVAGAVALFASTGAGGVWFLEGRVIRWFGSRSYGIYLWHAPILAAMAYHYWLPWQVLVVIGVPVSLLLAELSYRYVEAPFRARRKAPRPAGSQAGGVVEGVVSETARPRL